MSDEAIARIEERIDNIKVDMKDTRADMKEIHEAIVGKNGLRTDMAVTKTSLARAWWFITGISMTIIGSAVWIIRSSL